ncbi:NAD-dependent deacylase [Lentibacter sp. XHP0401]|uniref:NAD-dependent deacylase n=1 Tax=Lentibacter sp. XHP0401 TaxID=2984334 RepID=UPI0021E6F424|nr:NAD-dependent deacylase [Lentibacter sp. XHP0401]MCV2894388.1 NAD-dependent deacylase [Lentibacter sp. XHP0401]
MKEQIVILTGAGISAESGLGTFRDEGGLWAKHRIKDVATPEGFMRDPELVLGFYNMRRAEAVKATPNAAHVALAALEAAHDVLIVTQNVDGLHEAAGARNVLHMHGSLARAMCVRCEARWDAPLVMRVTDTCPECGAAATRPDIVWFGEMPYGMEEIDAALREATLFASVGTSGNVYPAAGFVAEARRMGVPTVELNLEPSAGHSMFDEVHVGPASEVVPKWVNALCRS